MMIIGVDYHPSFRQTAFLVEETAECGERRLNHNEGEAERFYRDLKQRGIRVRIGMEATGYSRWFERLLVTRATASPISRRNLTRPAFECKVRSGFSAGCFPWRVKSHSSEQF